MKRKVLLTMLAVIITLLLAAGYASAKQDYLPDVREFKLPNGLTLLVVERPDSPTVACYIYHPVGSVHEPPGLTGAAHMAEHMMFKGTKKLGTWNYEAEKPIMEKIDRLMDQIDRERVKGLTDYQKVDQARIDRLWEQVSELQKEQDKYIRKNEIWAIYDSHGSKGLNASTWLDRTDYLINLPSNKLELWAFIESDRLKNPVFREFYSERDVVYEERRMKVNNPGGAVSEAFFNAMFTALPYRHRTIGFASDIESFRRNEVLGFLKKYYAPNNTVIVLVGDVDAKNAHQLVKKYFGDIPRQPELKPHFFVEPEQRGERRIEVEFEGQPTLRIGYHGPKPGHPDQYALEVMMDILSSGRTGRFHQNIVRNNLAFNCSASLWEVAYANILLFGASPQKGVTTLQVEEAIYKEIDRLKTEPVSQWELEKVKNQNDQRFISLLRNRMNLARALAPAHVWTGNWRNIDNREKIRAVTAEDIIRVANKYFTKSNRTVATVVPPEKSQDNTVSSR
jgi:predicted Zn-dependent peptidase